MQRGLNQSGMRAYNERLVLTLVRQAGTLSKTGIARLTGLSAQTVSVIMRSLEADGLLKKDQPIRGKVGQPLMPMSLERNGAFFLGLRIGRRSLDLVLTDFLGHVESRIHLPHRYPTPDGVVRFANDGIGRLLDRLPAKHRARVAGLGIAIPFRLWDWAMPPGVEPRLLDRLPAEHRARVAGLGIAIPFRLWDWAMPPGVEPRLLDRLPAEHRARVAGLGIAIPFRLWDWAMPLGVELSDMADWRDRDIVTEIAEGRDFPVYLRNDASAACGADLSLARRTSRGIFSISLSASSLAAVWCWTMCFIPDVRGMPPRSALSRSRSGETMCANWWTPLRSPRWSGRSSRRAAMAT